LVQTHGAGPFNEPGRLRPVLISKRRTRPAGGRVRSRFTRPAPSSDNRPNAPLGRRYQTVATKPDVADDKHWLKTADQDVRICTRHVGKAGEGA
jgi:hypothetical protein